MVRHRGRIFDSPSSSQGLLVATACLSAATALAVAAPGAMAESQPRPQRAPREFVALSDVDPTIIQEMRYFGPHNFVGRRVTGYEEPLCIMTRAAAEGLRRAQAEFLRSGYSLKVYDCYRPQRAVNDFVAWAQDPRDQKMKDEFYPRLDKASLFRDGYIFERSGHSRGSTVDLTLVKIPMKPGEAYHPGQQLKSCFAARGERFADDSIDMGTGFDCFDTLANTLDPRVQGEQLENRLRLKEGMEAAGFSNLPQEWWHYTLRAEPFPQTYFDFPVSRDALDTHADRSN